MIELNNYNPMVRYGIAAALVRLPDLKTNLNQRSDLWILAKEALKDGINDLILAPNPSKDGKSIYYRPLAESQLENRQNAGNGFFIAPHILTSNNVSDLIKEVYKIIALLEKKDEGKNYELKRSFAPMIAKINAGKKSMSNPKDDLLEAAFTCVAAITTLKPAAYIKTIGDKFSNVGIIPDLPLFDKITKEEPLIEFIKLFQEIISHGVGETAYLKAPTKEKKFPRPDIFYGNYPNRPRSYGIGIVSLIAAIGKWANEHQQLFDNSQKVVEFLKNRPIYIVSYIGTQQEQYGHHLVELAMSGVLHSTLNQLPRVSLIGIEDNKKYNTPTWQLFVKSVDNFLRFFNESSWQNFLAHRATYPIEFFQILKSYFMQKNKYSEDIINSAVAYGKSLNRAAYLAAKQESAEDEKAGRKGRPLNEYKHRVLLQLESIIGSAESGTELIARLNSQVGRLTMQDVSSHSELFLKDVSNAKINIQDARHLITAFMRLSTYDPNSSNKGNSDSENIVQLSADGLPT